MQPDRPQPALTRQTAPTAFALRNIADRKARGRLRAAATAEAVGRELEWIDAEGWRYQLEAPPRVTIAPKDNERAAATVDLRVWDTSDTLIFRDRIHAWDGFPVLVPDGTQHKETLPDGTTHRVDNFRESPLEAARLDLAHTVRVVTKNGPWVKDKPGTVSTFYGETADGQIASSNATYLTMRSGSGLGANTAAGTIACYQNTGYEGFEGFFGWDTSSIGADTITDAAVSLYVQTGSVFGTGWTFEARDSNWGAALTTADWVAGASLGALTLLASLAQGSISAAAYADLTSSGSNLINWINPSGISYLLTCISTFVSGSTPSGAEGVIMSSADTAGTTQDPKLVVTHAAATKPFRRSLLGVGF